MIQFLFELYDSLIKIDQHYLLTSPEHEEGHLLNEPLEMIEKKIVYELGGDPNDLRQLSAMLDYSDGKITRDQLFRIIEGFQKI